MRPLLFQVVQRLPLLRVTESTLVFVSLSRPSWKHRNSTHGQCLSVLEDQGSFDVQEEKRTVAHQLAEQLVLAFC